MNLDGLTGIEREVLSEHLEFSRARVGVDRLDGPRNLDAAVLLGCRAKVQLEALTVGKLSNQFLFRRGRRQVPRS